MRTKEIKIENKFPNRQNNEIIVTRNGITVVYFKIYKTDSEYRFFINDNEELDRRLIERCKTLTIKEKHIKHAIAGIWEHIDFLLGNPTWKPAPPIEWIDKYNFKCPHCGEICNVNNKSYIPDEDAEMGLRYDFDFTCLNCKKAYPDNLWENLHFFIDEDACETYIRDKYIYEKRLSKETELEHRANCYNDASNSKTNIGWVLESKRLDKEISQAKLAKSAGVTIPTIQQIEGGTGTSYRSNALFAVMQELGASLLLKKDGAEATIKTKEELAQLLAEWRKDNTYYSLAKPFSIDWRRFKDIEECANYGIDHLLVYLQALGVNFEII